MFVFSTLLSMTLTSDIVFLLVFGSADRHHALDREAGALGDVGGTLTSNLRSRSESRSFGSVIIFMYLHTAFGLAGGQPRPWRGLAHRVEHPGLGGDDEVAVGMLADVARAFPRCENMWTPPSAMSPAATYSMHWVAQPHSGWIRNSASGRSARMRLMSSGLIPAWTWHSPGQTFIGLPVTRST